MTILKVLTYPDERLRLIAKPVPTVNDDVRRLLDDMHDTMKAEEGAGLAATQVGLDMRMFILHIEARLAEGQFPGPYFMVNPEIVWASDEMVLSQDGCLSVPEIYGEIRLHKEVKVKYLDYDGKPQELHAKGRLAQGIQHETDHLNGVLWIDRLSRLKRQLLLKKLERYQKACLV